MAVFSVPKANECRSILATMLIFMAALAAQSRSYSRAQKIAAVEHYLTHGGCLSFTRRAIGYPSNEVLNSWIQEFYPNSRPLVIRSGTNKCFSPKERYQAVRELCSRRGTARKVAHVPVLYKEQQSMVIARINAGISISAIAREFNTTRQTILRVKAGK